MLIPIAVAEAFFATAGRPAGQRQVHVRGRGGDRQPPSRRLRAAAQAAPRGGFRASRPTARCGASTSRRSPWRAADSAGSRSRSPRPPRICIRAATAAAWRIRCTPWPRSSPRCTNPTAASRWPGSTTQVRELSSGERAAIAALAVRRAGVSRAGRRAGGLRRARLHDARASMDAADARGQRPVGRLPGPGSEDRDPERGARQDHLPAGAGSGSGRGGGAGAAPSRGPRAAGRRGCRCRSRTTARVRRTSGRIISR